MKRISIAIDGPAGSGKSTIAKLVANRLGYQYLDTGSMYRAVSWYALKNAVAFSDEAGMRLLMQAMQLELRYGDNMTSVYVDGTDVTEAIRSAEITAAVSAVAQNASVRSALVEMQRRMSRAGGIVMDGRDIGTVVLPDAELKIFLIASVEERTRRRWLELKNNGVNVVYEELKSSIAERDYTDSHRAIAPLKQAEDAVLIDTTSMTIEEVCNEICALCEGKC